MRLPCFCFFVPAYYIWKSADAWFATESATRTKVYAVTSCGTRKTAVPVVPVAFAAIDGGKVEPDVGPLVL